MIRNSTLRWMAGLLVAAMAITTVAPAAEAKSRKHRFKRERFERRQTWRPAPRRVVEIRRSGDGVPAFAFIGGLVLGAALSNRAHADHEHNAYETPDYVYRDPYCDKHFPSLEIYVTHLRQHRHPRVVHVIDAHHGNHLDTYRYYRGDWVDWDDECETDW